MKRIVLFITFAMFTVPVFAQGPSPGLLELNEQRTQTVKVGMYTLGGWALTNMAVSGIGWANTTGQQRAFHQMNVWWNVVNLGLAAGSFIGMQGDDTTEWTPWRSLQDQMTLEKTFLFNAGLDLAYVTGGFYLRERAKADPTQADQWNGWGNSLLLQGGFLFAFDLAMYFILQPGAKQLEPFLTQVAITPTGFSLVIPIGNP